KTSSLSSIPTITIIGIETCCLTSYIIRIAIGFIAGPDSPPVLLAISGLLLGRWICIPVNVLIIDKPSAPASSTDLAIETISVTLGDNFTYTGSLLASLTNAVI